MLGKGPGQWHVADAFRTRVLLYSAFGALFASLTPIVLMQGGASEAGGMCSGCIVVLAVLIAIIAMAGRMLRRVVEVSRTVFHPGVGPTSCARTSELLQSCAVIILSTSRTRSIPSESGTRADSKEQNLTAHLIANNTIYGNGPDPDPGTTVPSGIVVFSDASGGAPPINGVRIVATRSSAKVSTSPRRRAAARSQCIKTREGHGRGSNRNTHESEASR